jgi:hypothetical protein
VTTARSLALNSLQKRAKKPLKTGMICVLAPLLELIFNDWGVFYDQPNHHPC